MRTLVATALLLAPVGLLACGEGDEQGDSFDSRPAQVVRCKPAPAGTEKLKIEPRFRAGDERRITIEKTRADPSRPEPLRATGDAELRVLSGGPRRAVLRWETGQVSLPLPENADADAVKKLEEVGERIPIEYDTEANGDVGRIRNVAQVRERLEKMLDTVAGLDPELARSADAARPLLQSEQAIQAGMGQEPELLHGAYGLTLAEGRPFRTPYVLPNPLGGLPIDADASFELERMRDASGCAIVQLVVDPKPAALRAFLRTLAERAGGPPPDDSDLAGVRLRNTARFSYDPGSGWAVRVEARRAISIQGRTRDDRTVLTNAPG